MGIYWCDIIPPWLGPNARTACDIRATFERLTGPKGLREPEATLEPRVHECVRHSSELYWAQVYSSLSFIFACLTPHNIVIEFLVPRAFQKFSTCMVYSDFLSPGKNSPLEGEGQ